MLADKVEPSSYSLFLSSTLGRLFNLYFLCVVVVCMCVNVSVCMCAAAAQELCISDSCQCQS